MRYGGAAQGPALGTLAVWHTSVSSPSLPHYGELELEPGWRNLKFGASTGRCHCASASGAALPLHSASANASATGSAVALQIQVRGP